MLEMKFEGLNKLTNINTIIKEAEVDPDHCHVSRVRCNISRYHKIFTTTGQSISGMVDVEIIRGKGKNAHITVIKNDKTKVSFEVDNGLIKL
jgi:hypothetical protein